MKIILDKELTYKDAIQYSLRAYNQSQIGVTEKEEFFIYIFENNALQGALSTSKGWDYVSYDELFYSNIDILKALHNEAVLHYKNTVTGYQFNSHIKEDINDFLSIGFSVLGKLDDFPIGFQKHYLVQYDEVILPCKRYEVITSQTKIEAYDAIQQERINEFKTKYQINDHKTEFNYVALEDEEFLGGVYSFLQEDYIYVSLLVVMEKHRGKDIGTLLMKAVEEQASILEVRNIYLGTASFQALDFYQKLGYKVVMTQDDYPKGHQVYTLHKEISVDK